MKMGSVQSKGSKTTLVHVQMADRRGAQMESRQGRRCVAENFGIAQKQVYADRSYRNL